VIDAVMSVSMNPGATALTVIPRDAYSRASVFVMPSSAAFVAAYAACPAFPISPTTLDRNTTRPARARIITLIAARAQASAPFTFTAKSRSRSSSFTRSRSPSIAIPALATRMSSRPSRFATSASAASAAFMSATSKPIASALPPRPVIPSTTARASASPRT
jgi:hypothetical protein